MTRPLGTKPDDRGRRWWLVGLLAGVALLVALAISFRPGTASVSGRVTDRGQPVAGGTVTMTAPDGTTVSAGIRGDATYALTGLPPGLVRIGVVVTTAGGRPDPPSRAPLGAKKSRPAGRSNASHADPAASGLTAELGRGSNTHDIDLH